MVDAGKTNIENVSILVVVDSLLQLQNLVTYLDSLGSFNPCCSGFIIATRHGLITQVIFARFNPCCSGFIIATSVSSRIHSLASCFNPCCSGFIIATQKEAWSRIIDSEFQSLL